MAKCKNCEKEYHICSSCDTSYDWEWNYCSTKCWENSNEFKRKWRKLEELRIIIPKKYYEVLEDDFFSNLLTTTKVDYMNMKKHLKTKRAISDNG